MCIVWLHCSGVLVGCVCFGCIRVGVLVGFIGRVYCSGIVFGYSVRVYRAGVLFRCIVMVVCYVVSFGCIVRVYCAGEMFR